MPTILGLIWSAARLTTLYPDNSCADTNNFVCAARFARDTRGEAKFASKRASFKTFVPKSAIVARMEQAAGIVNEQIDGKASRDGPSAVIK
ncbi:hypothetical protein CLM74_06090 [Stenotrophomonas sp. MYb57]|uniref:hypothetical protein n=1 Tax=Stenotrophomonas sp. MYb57 TaxID=1827305 RepID=UPI000CF62091|nr:hypothetical protein [Stenotrophomonas sp. MYb57]AVJ32377.1 hypothetical protein CLM74_06090 [Stenotrophomonas sp. MYb57]